MAEPRVGDTVDRRYALKRAIARGGAGTVYEAEHLITQRTVAVKVLNEQNADNTEARERLLREAQAITMARHPNVVTLLDAGRMDDDAPYLVMELLEGRTLAGILTARRHTSVADTVNIGRQLCEAIGAAHERGVVHRDIKPNNLFIAIDDSRHETLKVFDFGIAAMRGEEIAARIPKLTEHGTVVGTPEYMAPEQLMGQETVDHRCDIYGIGVTLYECLTGTVPFEGSFGRILLQASTQPIPPLTSRCPDAPAELVAVIERALARKPEDRFADAHELADAMLNAVGMLLNRTFLLGVRRPSEPDRHAAVLTIPAPAAKQPRRDVKRSEPAAHQRRRFARAPYTTPVTLVRADGTTQYGKSEDISEGGLLVMTDQVCDAGESVTACFAVPGTGQFVEAPALVRWCRSAREAGVVGVEFVAIDESVRDAIRQHVGGRHGTRYAVILGKRRSKPVSARPGLRAATTKKIRRKGRD